MPELDWPRSREAQSQHSRKPRGIRTMLLRGEAAAGVVLRVAIRKPRTDLPKFIILNTTSIVLNARFIVFDAKTIVFKCKIHRVLAPGARRPRAWCSTWRGATPRSAAAKSIILNSNFLVFDTEFLVFNTEFLVFDIKFIIFTHPRGCRLHTILHLSSLQSRHNLSVNIPGNHVVVASGVYYGSKMVTFYEQMMIFDCSTYPEFALLLRLEGQGAHVGLQDLRVGGLKIEGKLE